MIKTTQDSTYYQKTFCESLNKRGFDSYDHTTRSKLQKVNSWIEHYRVDLVHAVIECTNRSRRPLHQPTGTPSSSTEEVEFVVWVQLEQSGSSDLAHFFRVTEIGELAYAHMGNDARIGEFRQSDVCSGNTHVLVVFMSVWLDGTRLKCSRPFPQACGGPLIGYNLFL